MLQVPISVFINFDVKIIFSKLNRAINAYELCQRLEVIVCDAACSSLRPSIVSLVLLCCQLDSVVASLRPAPSRQEVTTLVTLIGQLQTHCRVKIIFIKIYLYIISNW